MRPPANADDAPTTRPDLEDDAEATRTTTVEPGVAVREEVIKPVSVPVVERVAAELGLAPSEVEDLIGLSSRRRRPPA